MQTTVVFKAFHEWHDVDEYAPLTDSRCNESATGETLNRLNVHWTLKTGHKTYYNADNIEHYKHVNASLSFRWPVPDQD